MRVEAFDFALPEDRIALRPVSPRDACRLLAVGPGEALDDRIFRDLPDLLRPGDALVLNDTKVIRARLNGVRRRGDSLARVEVLLHNRSGPDCWRALARPAKRLRAGDNLDFGTETVEGSLCIEARIEHIGLNGDIGLHFNVSGAALDEAIERLGRLPLPPYIEGRRAADLRDDNDYQTSYARQAGAVAAPTAGLHLTPGLLERLSACGIEIHVVTLHVGAGTFLPVKVDNTADHRMHPEWGRIDGATASALNAVRARGSWVAALGTTSLRLLESAADADGHVQPFEGWTDIFITPGYRFRAVDALVTNFHLPRSTLFMLVSAFAGLDTMRAAYAHAIEAGYRFYSYGDACLLVRPADR